MKPPHALFATWRAPPAGPISIERLREARDKVDGITDQILNLNSEYLGIDEQARHAMAQAASLLLTASAALHGQILLTEIRSTST
jgi:hypothetical protein